MKITIDSAFDKAKDNQLIVVLQGDKTEMLRKLEHLVFIMQRGEKPAQGASIGGTYDYQIITPVWDGKPY